MGFLKRHKWKTLCITLVLIATVALAAGYERIPKDILLLGTGTSDSKIIEFDVGNGSANPKIKGNSTSPAIEFSANGIDYLPLGSGGSGVGIQALANGDFELGTNNWSASAGTFQEETGAGDVGNGAKAVSWDATAASDTLTSDQATLPLVIQGQKCVSWFYYKGGDANLTAQVIDGSISVLASQVLATQGAYTQVYLYFDCPTGDTAALRLTATGDAATVYLDDAFLGVSITVLEDLTDTDTAAKEDGQALIYDSASEKWVPGASGDASFKVQDVAADGSTTIKGGYLILADGRELATYDGSGTASTDFGGDLAIDLDNLEGSPADNTTYYLYIDINALAAQITTSDTGRALYGVQEAQLVLSADAPDSVALSQLIPLGLVRHTTGGVWGTTAFATLAFRRHDKPVQFINPLVYSTSQVVGAVGTSGQIMAGHILTDQSFPDTDLTGDIVYWNLAADSNDDSVNGKNLTNNGTAPFSGTNIFGATTSAADLNGSTHYFSSTDAFFNPGNASYTVGGWFKMDAWASGATEVLFSTAGSTSDRSFGVYKASTDILYCLSTNTASNWDTTLPMSPDTSVLSGWQHIVIRYDASADVFACFINGLEVTKANVAAQRAASSAQFNIGAWYATPANYMAGEVEDVFFSNSALADEDVRKLYSAKLSLSAIQLEPGNQQWFAQYSRSDGLLQGELSPGWIVDKRKDALYFNLGLDAADTVRIAMRDIGFGSTSVASARRYDSGWQAAEQSYPLAHGLPIFPTAQSFFYDDAGAIRKYPIGQFCSVSDTQLNCEIDSLITIDATHKYRIILASGEETITSTLQEASPTQAGIVSTTAQSFAGEKTFNAEVQAVSGLDASGQGIVAGSLTTGDVTVTGSLGIDPTSLNDIDSTILGLKPYVSGTTYNGGNSPTISGTDYLSTYYGIFYPYRTQSGDWRCRFNFAVSTNSSTTFAPVINGITAKNVSGFFQPVAVGVNANAATQGHFSPNTGTIITYSTANGTQWRFSGDILLNQKPSWAY